jgi:transglutaminase-like putative cysteine protease
MRIKILHQTFYRYEEASTGVVQILRLTPRNHEGQYIVDWRLEVSAECRLHAHEDAFGNITHTFTTEEPLTELVLGVEGEVETQDTNGLVRGAIERFPASLFLRETPLTAPDAPILEFARECAAANPNPLALLHRLLERVHVQIAFDTGPTHSTTTAAEAFALKRGVCQDLTHIFIAAARSLGVPARYASGYFYRADGVTAQEAGHAWAEVFVNDLGWVGFDPANGICQTDAHVRVAVGLDYLGAAPVRGSRYGGGAEALAVAVKVGQAGQQSQ